MATLGKRHESLKLALGQLKYEDTVDNDRDSGLMKMRELKDKLAAVRLTLSETEAYAGTLLHMRNRSEDERLSSIAQLKAFETALTVHSQEAILAEDVLRTVNKARDDELHALHDLHTELRQAITTLDKKLEARRHEVKNRQDRARIRIIKMQEELALRAAAMGDLTESEERAMIEKARNLTAEHTALRAEKIRVQAEADASESEFQQLCFAAGVPISTLNGPSITDVATDPGTTAAGAQPGSQAPPEEFVPPDPSIIVDRFAQLDQDMGVIRDVIAEHSARLALLQQQQGVLNALAQPLAKDSSSSSSSAGAAEVKSDEIEVMNSLLKRIESMKRSLQSSTGELEKARSIKLHLEQSLSNLNGRVGSLVMPTISSGLESEERFGVTVDEMDTAVDSLPTSWARQQASTVTSLVRKFHLLMLAIDGDVAGTCAVRMSDKWERSALGTEAVSKRPVDDGSKAAARAAAVAAALAKAQEDAEDAEDAGQAFIPAPIQAPEPEVMIDAEEARVMEEKLNATIESLIVSNEWSIRVRPGASGSAVTRNISGKALTEAVAAFEKTWRDGMSAESTLERATTASRMTETQMKSSASTIAADPFSAEGAAARRKSVSNELAAAYSVAATAAGANESKSDFRNDLVRRRAFNARKKICVCGPGSLTPPQPKFTAPLPQVAKARAAAASTEATKPKARDIQRYLAIASAMVGDDFEEGFQASLAPPAAGGRRADATDGVMSRDALKRQTTARVQLAEAKAAALAAEKEAQK